MANAALMTKTHRPTSKGVFWIPSRPKAARALTAPEGKIVLRGLRHRRAEGRRGDTRPRTPRRSPPGMGFPVVLKIVSPEILHKTEAGGVLVGVKSAEEAQKGYDTIIANAKKYNADAKIVGVQVQQMLAGGKK